MYKNNYIFIHASSIYIYTFKTTHRIPIQLHFEASGHLDFAYASSRWDLLCKSTSMYLNSSSGKPAPLFPSMYFHFLRFLVKPSIY